MKNLLKITLILSIVITFNLNTFGQQQFGIKVSRGISRIYGSTDSRYLPPFTMSTSFSPSFQAGLYYKFPTSKKSSIGTELLFSQVEGGQTVEWDYKDIGRPDIDGYRSDFTYEHISYLSLPVYYGVTYKRLTFNGGFQISYAFSSYGSDESNSVYIVIDEEGDPIIMNSGIKRELDKLDIKDFDFGPRVGVIYRLTNRFSMEGMFYYGINNIKSVNSSEEELRIQQMTLGIRYALWSKDATK